MVKNGIKLFIGALISILMFSCTPMVVGNTYTIKVGQNAPGVPKNTFRYTGMISDTVFSVANTGERYNIFFPVLFDKLFDVNGVKFELISVTPLELRIRILRLK